jgi:hypothetical protein
MDGGETKERVFEGNRQKTTNEPTFYVGALFPVYF